MIHTAVTGRAGLEDPVWMVRRGPHELLDWGVRNSQRLDVELRKDWLDCCNASLAVTPCACHLARVTHGRWAQGSVLGRLPPDESPDNNYADDVSSHMRLSRFPPAT